jgi:ABC-type transporter Mla subunit MlaD
MNERQRELRRVVTNFGNVTDLLAKRDDQLNRLINAGDSTLQELASVNGPVGETINRLPVAMTAIRNSFSAVDRAEDEIDPTLTKLMPTADELENGLEGLRQFSRDATPALRDLQPALTQLEPLAHELEPTSRSLSGTFTQLQQDAPRFDGVTQTASQCLDTSLSRFFQDSLSVLKFGDAYGAIPRGTLSQGTSGFETVRDPGIKETTPCYAQGDGSEGGSK